MFCAVCISLTDLYRIHIYFVLKIVVMPGTKLECCIAKSDVSKSLYLDYIIYKTSIRSALWERVILNCVLIQLPVCT